MGDCTDCDKQCAEHDLRWGSFDTLQQKVDDMERATEVRRAEIDRRLEAGVTQFAKLNTYIAIFMAIMLAMFCVAGFGYGTAINVKDNLSVHIAGDNTEFSNMKNHIDLSNRQIVSMEKESEQVHELSNLAIATSQILKQIESRLERIEKKI